MEETNEDITDGDASYSGMRENSEYLLSFLGKYVTIKLIKDIQLLGFVHAIDPVTGSIILQSQKEDSAKAVLIPDHAVLEIILAPIPEGTPTPQKMLAPVSEADSKEITLRKHKLISWFKKNLLPVTEDGKEIVVGSASVLPPYRSQDIYAENSVVAIQIQKIIDFMPENIDSV